VEAGPTRSACFLRAGWGGCVDEQRLACRWGVDDVEDERFAAVVQTDVDIPFARGLVDEFAGAIDRCVTLGTGVGERSGSDEAEDRADMVMPAGGAAGADRDLADDQIRARDER
jgi:hypothetical protein